MNKKNKEPQKSVKEQLQESSRMIDNSIAFWEEQMDVVIKKMDEAEQYPDWHPEKTEEVYHKLNLDMQFILKRLQNEEQGGCMNEMGSIYPGALICQNRQTA